MFERHPYTTQSFIPMGKSDLVKGGEGMVVIVALNGDGKDQIFICCSPFPL